MRSLVPSFWYRILLVLSVTSFLQVVAEPNLEALDQVAGSEDKALVDVCAPLHQAQTLLQELQPAPYAHLDRKIGGSISYTSRGWGDGLGWGHEGPLSTAFRIIPRFLNTLLSPSSLLSRIPLPSISSSPIRKGVRISKTRKGKIDMMLRLMEDAEKAGCDDVWSMRGKVAMLPPKGMEQDLGASFKAYERYLEITSDAEAQFMLGMFYSTGIGGVQEDQGKALLYYTFSALQGYRPAEMALGYRYWAGIGVKEECLTALDYYEGAAEKAYEHFLSGPAGGRTLPLTPVRLSDRVGGIYGPHASWASTGSNMIRAAVRASSASARGETEQEILEYYQYHSDRDSHIYTTRLGRLFYFGSVYPLPGGVSSGAESVGEIPQSYVKAREYFLKVARVLWPFDFDSNGAIAPKRKLSKEQEHHIKDPAMIAASFLGRMFMRGEGMKKDYHRARLWYERAAELGDREAHNGLGVIYRDGLGVPVDTQKAYHFFQAAAGQDLAEAQVNLGKLHLDRGEISKAVPFLEVAIRHGSQLEAFHLSSRLHAATARLPPQAGGRPRMCGVSVAWFKMVAERGSWTDDFTMEADKAWARGEEDNAMVGWLIGAEMGSEIAQNNAAFLLDQGRGGSVWQDPSVKSEYDLSDGSEPQELKERGMRWWIRSAAQNNVDAMVKVGDLYYDGVVSPGNHTDYDHYELAANYYQTAADMQSSAMAYWNLGWMYEKGQGVPRDWHLAKRYYDMSGETSLEAWPAVILSLIGLHVRSWWTEFKTRGEIRGLRFQQEDDKTAQLGLFARLRSTLFSPSWLAPLLEMDDYELDDGQMGEMYDDISGSGWGGGAAGEGRAAGGVDDPDWDEDFVETVAIVAVMLSIMGLVWLRNYWTNREEQRVREEQERRQRGEVEQTLR